MSGGEGCYNSLIIHIKINCGGDTEDLKKEYLSDDGGDITPNLPAMGTPLGDSVWQNDIYVPT